MARFYNDKPQRAPRTHSMALAFSLIAIMTVIDFIITLFLTAPCLRSLYARQNNLDYNAYLAETQITALQQRNAELEKELRLLRQDVAIIESLLSSGEYSPVKE